MCVCTCIWGLDNTINISYVIISFFTYEHFPFPMQDLCGIETVWQREYLSPELSTERCMSWRRGAAWAGLPCSSRWYPAWSTEGRARGGVRRQRLRQARAQHKARRWGPGGPLGFVPKPPGTLEPPCLIHILPPFLKKAHKLGKILTKLSERLSSKPEQGPYAVRPQGPHRSRGGGLDLSVPVFSVRL